MRKVKPTNDLLFRKTLASEENKDILQGLIRDTFGINPETITIKNPYSIHAYTEIKNNEIFLVERETIKDVAVYLEMSDFTVELQVRKTKFFNRRSLYYVFDAFCGNFNLTENLELGSNGEPDRFSSLRPIYSLNILDEKMFTQDTRAFRVF